MNPLLPAAAAGLVLTVIGRQLLRRPPIAPPPSTPEFDRECDKP